MIHARVLASILAALLAVPAEAQSWLPTSPFPAWGATQPATILTLDYDQALTAAGNGARLVAATNALSPGQGLAIGPGVWLVPQRIDLHGVGSPQAPIWLFAADPSQRPVITRADASQNALNMGSNGAARYWVLRDLEITGGSDLLRLYDCAQVWIDRCFLHDGSGVGIAANTFPCDHLHLTRNHIARPGPGTTGEGIYLGGNFGSVIVSWSIVAGNHVHDTRTAVAGQGDGIELKQGSHHNWIVGNHVHDCRNPCILVYGTDGTAENVVDGNYCYDSDDVVLQVQGEAIVRNNVALGGSNAFSSHDHQGPSRDLVLMHNTFVSQNRAASMQSWNNRPGMVVANNVCYSLGAESIRFGNGSAGVQMAGNVVLGPVQNASGGFTFGSGLQDFVDVWLSPWRLDVTPRVGGAIDNRGEPSLAFASDLLGRPRMLPTDPGAVTNPTTFAASTPFVNLATGGVQQLDFDAPAFAGMPYVVVGSISGTMPGAQLGAITLPLQVDDWTSYTLTFANSGGLQNTLGLLDGAGRATASLVLPPLPPFLNGLVAHHALVVIQGTQGTFASNPVSLTLQ